MSFAVATASTDVAAIIEARVIDAWTDAGQTEANIAWDNATLQPAAGAKFARVTILPEGGAMSEIGGTNVRAGRLSVLIFGPKNEGVGPLRAIADAFAARFDRQVDSGVRFMGRFGETMDDPQPFPDRNPALAAVRLQAPFHYYVAI